MPVHFERGRVVEVWAPGAPEGRVGSGYLLEGGLVLTAAHVVAGAPGGHCEARPLGRRDWVSAEVEWLGERCDAALLHLTGESGSRADGPARLGRLAEDERAPCRAVGFPFAQAKDDGVRDTEDLAGELAPLAAAKGGLVTVHVAGSVPSPGRSDHSPWEGMSGSALFSGPVIVGVIVVDPAHFGTDRLQAVPVTALAAEPGFRAALTGDADAELRLQAVEDLDVTHGLMRQPYRPMTASASPKRLRRATHFLVAPEYGIVPFHGRARDLGELQAWSTGDPGLELGLVLGPGGTGKTRLAAELCRRAQIDGAMAGFLETGLTPAELGRLGEVTAPLLVVVDDAPGRVEEVAVLLRKLADAEGEAPQRVLLLARGAGGWWDRLPQRLGDNPDAEFAHSVATVRTLAGVDPSPATRETAFREAADAFRRRMAIEVAALPLPDLSQGLFDQILYVHLAALSALEGDRSLVEGPILKQDLLKASLKREARYWADTAESAQIDLQPILLERAVALATLTRADGEEAAASALRAIPEFADATRERRGEVARWLSGLYPPPAGQSQAGRASELPVFQPLTPSPLGEALIAQVLDGDPALPSRLLGMATPPQAQRALMVLNRAARSHPVAQDALERAMADHLETHWAAAIKEAQAGGDPLGRLLAAVLEATPRPELAVRIEAALPRHTVALRELAVLATQQALDHVRSCPPSLEREENIARLTNNLATRLTGLGRLEEALAASEDAVAIRRRMASIDPDAFLPDLAWSLSEQSACLGALGRREDALTAIGASVAIRRRLADAGPGEFLATLAESLDRQANRLRELGRPEEALDAIEESVRLYHALADARPQAFLGDLAAALSTRSSVLAELGRRADALAAIQESVAIRRRRADSRPDAFLPDLAASLNNEANTLGDLGRHEQALAAITESVRIRRQLARTLPSAFLADLAASLNNQSVVFGALGRREEALAAIEEAVAVYREQAEARPGAFLPRLAAALTTQSNRLSQLGRRDAALAAVEESVSLYGQLAAAGPDAFRPDLAMSLHNLAAQLGALGRAEDALAAVERSIEIRRALADARPEAFAGSLARSLINQSALLAALGRNDEAVAPIDEALRLLVPVLERSPQALPDAGAGLTATYRARARAAGREPDPALLERLAATAAAGADATLSRP